MLKMLCIEGLVPNQCQDPSRGSHYYMRAVVLQGLFILLDGDSPKEDGDLYIVKILAKSLIFFIYLEGQFPTQRKKNFCVVNLYI